MGTVDDSGVRDPVPLDELVSNLDRDIASFLTNFRFGAEFRDWSQATQIRSNPSDSAFGQDQILHREHGTAEQLRSGMVLTVFQEEVWGSLKGLDVGNLFFPQLSKNQTWAKPAQSRWLLEGLPLHVYHYETNAYKTGTPADAVQVNLIADWQSLEKTCPGYGLYKLGLVLREPVLIERNGLEVRTHTWGSYKVQVRPPLAPGEDEEDQLGLINRFIHDFKTANK
jgi:hypothetical protein